MNSAIQWNRLLYISIFNAEAGSIWLYLFVWTLEEAMLTPSHWQPEPGLGSSWPAPWSTSSCHSNVALLAWRGLSWHSLSLEDGAGSAAWPLSPRVTPQGLRGAYGPATPRGLHGRPRPHHLNSQTLLPPVHSNHWYSCCGLPLVTLNCLCEPGECARIWVIIP